MPESDLKAQLAVAEARLHALTRQLVEVRKLQRQAQAWRGNPHTTFGDATAVLCAFADLKLTEQEDLARVDTPDQATALVPQPSLGDPSTGSTEAETESSHD